MNIKNINPNSDKQHIDSIDLAEVKNFPKFLLSTELIPFRHINNLKIDFIHPISVISGTNRSGKSTILMTLACSHFNFKKRNVHNGKLERQTWSSMMQFTSHDKQTRDWTYYITYKLGSKTERKRGQRKFDTKKWNGIGKKESQFRDREVVFIDLDRVLPARNFGKTTFNKAKRAVSTPISPTNVDRIETYLSYVLEQDIKMQQLAKHLDKDIYKYNNANEYSSYNAATGEEVLAKIIIDTIEIKKDSLVLIDEIEVGLHPKVQRRLIDVLYHIARTDNKQFIITSHSPSILSSLPDKSRTFIEKQNNGEYKAIPNISVNAALSKMDSISYPLVDIFCEDKEAYKIIKKAIFSIQTEQKLNNFNDLINPIIVGSADKTYNCLKAHQETYDFKKIKTGVACILDGDQRSLYAPEECLHFIYSKESPEQFLVRSLLSIHPQPQLQYHLENSNPHCLFDKMIEFSLSTTKEESFELCWATFLQTADGIVYFDELKSFIVQMAKKYSPNL